MSHALMMSASTGDYETVKLLIEEFDIPVDYACYKINIRQFVGKTTKEKEELFVKLQNKFEIDFGEKTRELIKDDKKMLAFINSEKKYFVEDE